MDAIRRWALLTCTAAVLCTLLSRLFPDSALGRQGRLLLPCIFLCVTLSPLLSMRWSLPALPQTQTAADTAALEARMRQQTVAQVNTTLLRMINQALQSYGLQAEKVVADTDIAADGSIDIGQITVYVDSRTAQRSVLVKQVAEKRLGTTVVVAQKEAGNG